MPISKPLLPTLLKSTALSVLVFGTISFVSVLPDFNTPLKPTHMFEHTIGFPFTYYHDFLVDCPVPNSSWNAENLLLDYVITWILVTFVVIKVRPQKA